MPDKDKPKPKSALPYISQDDLQKFGNWTGKTDTKEIAADLMKRGLVGANQLVNDNPDITSANGIRNAQSDWKIAAIQDIVANARKYNLRSPEAVMANKHLLVSNPNWRAAIEDPYFNHIHPNWWSTITHSILPEQYAKEAQQNLVAKK